MKEQRDLYIMERNLRKRGFCHIAGVDEAGRGPLAGPVYAAAVILPEHCSIDGLDDSKKLTEKKREQLYIQICELAVAYHIAQIPNTRIDEINILEATFEAMQQAIAGLSVPADYVLIDGNRIKGVSIAHETVIKGDSLSASIAAASILAKVSRDHEMQRMAELYPEYGFDVHKGYGTRHHLEMIQKYGPCPIHRLSFRGVREYQ